ncbi:MAG: twin-arginine translocase TatA/TatE family subunit [Planctomycetota bacterium]|nr:twin-arginine translocase TatA/TatE family subunit [Planctomycetota bacterium]
MPFNLSTGEILVLLFVAILVFGGRLPEVARKVGRTITEFKRGISEEAHRIERETAVEEPPPSEWTAPPDGEECEGFEGGK